jgi:hypothetical protein
LDNCKPLHIADVNGDRRTDLICPYDFGDADTRTLVQISSGTAFDAWVSTTVLHTSFDVTECASGRVGDVNGDGGLDIICPYNYGSAIARTFVQTTSRSLVYLPLVAVGGH